MWLYVFVCVFCVTFTLSIQLVNDKHLDYILVNVCVCVTENLHHSLVSVLPSKSISRYGYKLLCFFILLLISFPLHERLFANEGELLGKSECVSVCVCAI